MPEPMRVLMLPGFSQSVAVFRQRMSAIEQECGPDVEFVYVEPTHIIPPESLEGGINARSLDSIASLDPELPSHQPRAWCWPDPEQVSFIGIEESIIYIRDFLAGQERPFTGLFGFSVGGAFGALVTALLERPYLYPEFLIDGKSPAPPLKFSVFISGFLMWDSRLTPITTGGTILTPTLHVFGTRDVIVREDQWRGLVDWCQDPRLERHSGGHVMPSSSSWRRFLKEHLTSFVASRTDVTSVLSPSFEVADSTTGVKGVGRAGRVVSRAPTSRM